MIYSARDIDELETFWTIVLTAYYHARGLGSYACNGSFVRNIGPGQENEAETYAGHACA